MAVHEEVFRAWPSLAAAIDERRGDLKVRTWLRRDAETWRTSGRGQAPLTGGRLELALDWARRNPGDLTDPVRAYLRVARNQRRRRRLLAVVAPILAVIAVAVGVLAIRANDARRGAEALRLTADARAAFDTRLDLGLILALQAGRRSTDLGVQSMLLVGLSRGPGPRSYEGPRVPVTLGSLDEAGTRAVMSGIATTVIWDLERHSAVATLPGGADAVAISPDGSTVAIAREGALELRRSVDGSLLGTCPTGEKTIERLGLSARGELVASVNVDREASTSRFRILATADCAERSAGDIPGIVSVMDLDAADQRIAFGTQGDGVTVRDLENAVDLGPFQSDSAFIWAIDLGGEDRLAALDEDGQLLQWDARTGEGSEPIKVFDATGTVIRIGDGGTLMAAARDGRIATIQPDSQRPVGTALQSLPELAYGGDDGILDLAITPTGAVTLDQSGRIVTWDVTGRPAIEQPPSGRRLLSDIKVEHATGMTDGSVLAAGGSSVWRLDGESGDVRSRVDGVAASAIAVRGEMIAIGTVPGVVRVGSGSLDSLRDLPSRHAARIVGLAILASGAIAAVDSNGKLTIDTPDGASATVDLGTHAMSMAANDDRLFVGMEGGAVLVVDPSDTSRTPIRVDAHRRDVTAMAMRPDGRSMATGSDDRSIVLWDVDSRGALTTHAKLAGHSDKITSLAWSPDGRYLASAAEDHRVILWDLERGAGIGDPIAVPGAPIVGFIATGDRQLLVGGDGLVRWDMRPETWAEIACSIVKGRALNDVERSLYFGGDQPETTCQ